MLGSRWFSSRFSTNRFIKPLYDNRLTYHFGAGASLPPCSVGRCSFALEGVSTETWGCRIETPHNPPVRSQENAANQESYDRQTIVWWENPWRTNRRTKSRRPASNSRAGPHKHLRLLTKPELTPRFQTHFHAKITTNVERSFFV